MVLRRAWRAAIALALVAVAIFAGSACAPAVGEPSLVLRAVTPDAVGEPAAVQLARFALEVDRISAGTIRIESGYLAAGRDTPRYDQVTAGLVASGDAELGWIPSRTWDTEGVTTLAALNAPFLVADEGMLERILNDADLRTRLLAGLPAAGVVGIDLFPEGMRHPFGFGAPLLGPEDYYGEAIRSPESATVWATLEALGALPLQVAPDSATQRGMESSYESARAGFATSNVTFFPKTNVLVAGAEVRARLTDAQWDVLTRAADATRRWLFETRRSDVEAALAFCERGGTIVAATPAQLDELAELTSSVVADLQRDAAVRALIADIRDLPQDEVSATVLTSCPGTPIEAERSDSPDAGTQLNGTYAFEATESAVRAAGVTGDEFVQTVTGQFQVAIDYPQFHVHQESPNFLPEPDWSGTLEYENGEVRFQWTPAAEDWSSARVSVEKDGTLVFNNHKDGMPGSEWPAVDRVWFDRWVRVSDSTAPPEP